jgi:hypothetical protein
MFDAKCENGEKYRKKSKVTGKKATYKAIKMYANKTDHLNCCQPGAKKNPKYKSIIGNNYILDESKFKSRPNLVDTGNLREEYFSQTEGLLSVTLDIESIMEEREKLNDSEERCAMAGLFSTNLSYKLAEEIPKVAKVKDATFDIDNISVSGVIVKKLLLDNFNKSCDESSLKLSSLELTNILHVNLFLAHVASFFEQGFKNNGDFDNIIQYKCHIRLDKLNSKPRNFTHIKKEKKYNQTIEIPSDGIFGGSSICRIAVGYNSKETGKNISISLFNYFAYLFYIYIYFIFIIIFPYNIRCQTIRCERQFMDNNQIGCDFFTK